MSVLCSLKLCSLNSLSLPPHPHLLSPACATACLLAVRVGRQQRCTARCGRRSLSSRVSCLLLLAEEDPPACRGPSAAGSSAVDLPFAVNPHSPLPARLFLWRRRRGPHRRGGAARWPERLCRPLWPLAEPGLFGPGADGCPLPRCGGRGLILSCMWEARTGLVATELRGGTRDPEGTAGQLTGIATFSAAA